MMYNPCFVCGNEPQLEVHVSNMAFMKCNHCGRFDYYNAWNSTNPIPEPDPLAIAHEQLAECYELLDGIVAARLVNENIRELAKALLAKHRSENA